MLAQIAVFLVETVSGFFVLMLLARFHFQWLRVPFRNPVGEFVLATTSWVVIPARRIVPGMAGLDLASLLLAWLVQMFALWAVQAGIIGADTGVLSLAVGAMVDLLRYSVYILVFALIVQAILSWVNPYTPLAPAFDTITRPFLRPLRRFVPPVGNVDLTPLILLVILYIVLIVINHLRASV